MSLEFSFNDHSDLVGQHALFSPSQSAWLRYDDEKIIDKIRGQYRTALGTEFHEFAASQINLAHKKSNMRAINQDVENYIYWKYTYLNNIKYGMNLIKNLAYVPKEVYDTLKYYINDGIGYGMTVEQPLQYSKNIFGTSDSICYKNKNKLLRIHDLKTGDHSASMEQLEVYAALFCLEYDIKPSEIEMELRLYQLDGMSVTKPTVEDILPIIDRIVSIEKLAFMVEKENK